MRKYARDFLVRFRKGTQFTAPPASAIGEESPLPAATLIA